MGKFLEGKTGQGPDQGHPQPPVSTESLLMPGGVEDLTKQGRVLGFMDAVMDGKKIVIGVVAPEGLQPEDECFYDAVSGGVAVFKSPKGDFRGLATMVPMTPQQRVELESRIQTVLNPKNNV